MFSRFLTQCLFVMISVAALQTGVNAGQLVGNGGLVLHCPSGESSNQPLPVYMTLDFFEYRDAEDKIDTSLNEVPGDAEQIAGEVLLRLSRVDHVRASRYRYWLTKFKAESRLQDSELPRTMDAGRVAELPRHCQILQAIIQVTPRDASAPRYLIDRLLWDKLSHLDKAGLIVHEFVVRDAKDGDLLTTEDVRRFVRFLFSTSVIGVKPDDYGKVLAASGLAASSRSAKMAQVFEMCKAVLENRVLRVPQRTDLRYQGREIVRSSRDLKTGSVNFYGNTIEIPITMYNEADFWENKGSERLGGFLRAEKSRMSGTLRIFELASSDVIFASIQSTNERFVTMPQLQGIIQIVDKKITFKGHTAGFFDYKYGKNKATLARSRFSFEWFVEGSKINETMTIESFEVNQSDWTDKASLGLGWPW